MLAVYLVKTIGGNFKYYFSLNSSTLLFICDTSYISWFLEIFYYIDSHYNFQLKNPVSITKVDILGLKWVWTMCFFDMIWNFSVVGLLIRSSASASWSTRKRTFSEKDLKCDMWRVPLCSRTEVCEKVRKVQSIESHHTFLPFSPDLATCVSVLFTKVKFKLDSWWFDFFGWNPVYSVVMQVQGAQKGPTVQEELQRHIRRWPWRKDWLNLDQVWFWKFTDDLSFSIFAQTCDKHFQGLCALSKAPSLSDPLSFVTQSPL